MAVAVIERRVRFDGEAVVFGSMLRRRALGRASRSAGPTPP
jgi:hypothetical protein